MSSHDKSVVKREAKFKLSDDGTLDGDVRVEFTALLIFGFVKGRFTGTRPMKSALQTALIGSVAAGAAYGIARLIGG